MFIHPLSQRLHGFPNVPCLGTSFPAAYQVDNVGQVTRVCTVHLVDGVLTCDDGIRIDDPARLAEVAVARLLPT